LKYKTLAHEQPCLSRFTSTHDGAEIISHEKSTKNVQCFAKPQGHVTPSYPHIP